MVVEAFVQSVNQSIETGIEEISVHVTETLHNSFLNFGIDSEMMTCQELLPMVRRDENHLVRERLGELPLNFDHVKNRLELTIYSEDSALRDFRGPTRNCRRRK
ncbi:hypothetical protein AVEN_78394-1 [Araneus ventricosus]|uniref:Uncharacterized protein n=1 Tax=Araneus ventricosus TaxID=182803 RepID=A0A4Y2SS67_ARAVE|nr:hypothetical protein AVEN_261256-1 [Araneus ventricosus]GBN90050.1 hypothetical protein AVEN_78394-1 [Araneus ventricosus]